MVVDCLWPIQAYINFCKSESQKGSFHYPMNSVSGEFQYAVVWYRRVASSLSSLAAGEARVYTSSSQSSSRAAADADDSHNIMDNVTSEPLDLDPCCDVTTNLTVYGVLINIFSVNVAKRQI